MTDKLLILSIIVFSVAIIFLIGSICLCISSGNRAEINDRLDYHNERFDNLSFYLSKHTKAIEAIRECLATSCNGNCSRCVHYRDMG